MKKGSFVRRGARSGLVAAALAAAFAAACSDHPLTAPPAPAPLADGGAVDGGFDVHGLPRGAAVSGGSASIEVGPNRAARLDVPHAGFALIVPRGAVHRRVTITATVIPGDQIAYDFQPHGLVFDRPVIIEQRLAGTAADGDPATAARLVAGYFPGLEFLAADASGLTRVIEFEPVVVDADARRLEITIAHFSGYILALGNTATPTAPAPATPTS